jgi:hypothetical protein
VAVSCKGALKDFPVTAAESVTGLPADGASPKVDPVLVCWAIMVADITSMLTMLNRRCFIGILAYMKW